jgi:hypothetical protein
MASDLSMFGTNHETGNRIEDDHFVNLDAKSCQKGVLMKPTVPHRMLIAMKSDCSVSEQPSATSVLWMATWLTSLFTIIRPWAGLGNTIPRPTGFISTFGMTSDHEAVRLALSEPLEVLLREAQACNF